jgi:hypothetical protein
MGGRRIAVIALSGALVAGGAGAAIARVTKDDGKQAEQEVLADAAKRLNVTPEKLRDALAAAQDAQLDQAVKDGDLTQKQADEIKQARKSSGHVLGPPLGPWLHGRRGRMVMPGGPGPMRGPGGKGFVMRHGLLDDIAKALGTTQAKLFEALRSGKSIADVAKANGKSMADVRAAVEASVKSRLDEAVKDGDLTRKQADELLARADKKLAAIESGRRLRLHRHGGRRHMPLPAPDEVRPGALLPGEQAPELAPPGAIFD